MNEWEQYRKQGISEITCQQITKTSRATYYRSKKIIEQLKQGIAPPSKRPKRVNKPKWGEAELQLVLKIRRLNPTYGKDKIATILKRDEGKKLSPSTVNRILNVLKERGLVQRSASALRVKRKRSFASKHASAWTYKKYEEIQMGERVQIDHMTVSVNGITIKQFQAWDRKSKFIHAQVYSHAKSSSAKRFLLELIEKAPFTITSVQVDGGSEFMAHFEETCRELNIPLLVLPPRKPAYNGGVERGNRTFKEEFYRNPKLIADSVGAIRAELSHALYKYNAYRPHSSLKGLTPFAYIQSIQSGGLS